MPLLEAAGLEIVDVQEWEGRVSFTDVGAIVYYLKTISWEVPGFTVKTHLRYLYALQERLDAGEELGFFAGKFLPYRGEEAVVPYAAYPSDSTAAAVVLDSSIRWRTIWASLWVSSW